METDLTLTTAYLGGTEGHAVLKITFAELLRSGSRFGLCRSRNTHVKKNGI
jgi:hypothetical protein